MTAQLELERILDEFLGEGTDELSDHVLDAALGDITHTQQRRAWRVPRRFSDMPTPVRLLAVAAILAAAMGGAFILGGTLNRDATTEPVPEPSPTDVDAAPERIGLDRGGQWSAGRSAAFGSPAGQYTLILDQGSTVIAWGPDDRDILLGTLQPGARPGTAVLGATQSCATEGTYTTEYSADDRTLDVGLIEDACADRATLVVGSWARSLIQHPLSPRRRYVVDLQPKLSFVVPADFRDGDGNAPIVSVPLNGQPNEMVVEAGEDLALFWTADEVPGDRCDSNVTSRPTPANLDEFVAWNRDSTGVLTSDPIRTTVGGHDAIAIDVGGTEGCPNGEVEADCGCVPGLNLTDVNGTLFERIWAVDVDGEMVIVLFHDDGPPWLSLTPEREAIAQELIDSIQFE